jgi:hypothetical protein
MDTRKMVADAIGVSWRQVSVTCERSSGGWVAVLGHVDIRLSVCAPTRTVAVGKLHDYAKRMLTCADCKNYEYGGNP